MLMFLRLISLKMSARPMMKKVANTPKRKPARINFICTLYPETKFLFRDKCILNAGANMIKNHEVSQKGIESFVPFARQLFHGVESEVIG